MIVNLNKHRKHITRRIEERNGAVRMTRRDQVVHSDPDILGGTPVFFGTRVPVRSLFDYLEGGDTLDEFLRQFPSVRREQAVAALDIARESLLADARPA
jgi:uncharacterized protein (DUF433 family)